MATVMILHILTCVAALLSSVQGVDPVAADFSDKVIALTDENADGQINEAELSSMLAIFSVATGPTTNTSANEDGKRSIDDVQDKCYSLEEYMSIGGSTPDGSGGVYLTTNVLPNIYPVIIEQVMTSACTSVAPPEEEDSGYTNALKWGIATAAYAVLVSLAFSVVLLYGFMNSSKFRVILQFLIALGIGTMMGGGLLHLIPRALGLEGEEEPAEPGAEEEEDESFIWKLTISIAGFYVFFLLENSILLYNRRNGTNFSFHDHEHSPKPVRRFSSKVSDVGRSNGAFEDEDKKEETGFSSTKTNGDVEKMEIEEPAKKEAENPYFWGLSTVGFVIFVADCVHNIGDGFIVGVGFTASLGSGIGTFIAILCHKIPHEFGNFGIYLNNGISGKWKAAFLNLIANCFGFIGLYIVIGLDLNEEQTSWFIAVVVGMFLYIALIDMLPEMVNEVTDWPATQFLCQNLGLLLGWAIMLLLAVYEEDITAAVSG